MLAYMPIICVLTDRLNEWMNYKTEEIGKEEKKGKEGK